MILIPIPPLVCIHHDVMNELGISYLELKTVSDLNTQYYNQHAQEFVESTLTANMTPLYNEFLPYVHAGGHILDCGCGSGRDAIAFQEYGYAVSAIDASEELVKIASERLGQHVALKTFQQINDHNAFDGIWCSASLLHVPFKKLPFIFTKLTRALKNNGVLYVSFKYGEPSDEPREHQGREFTDLNEFALNNLLDMQSELQLIKTWVTTDTRPNREGEKWLNAIVTKNSLKAVL